MRGGDLRNLDIYSWQPLTYSQQLFLCKPPLYNFWRGLLYKLCNMLAYAVLGQGGGEGAQDVGLGRNLQSIKGSVLRDFLPVFFPASTLLYRAQYAFRLHKQ